MNILSHRTAWLRGISISTGILLCSALLLVPFTSADETTPPLSVKGGPNDSNPMSPTGTGLKSESSNPNAMTIAPTAMVAELKRNNKRTEHAIRSYLAQLKQAGSLSPLLAQTYNKDPGLVAFFLSQSVRAVPIQYAITQGVEYGYDQQLLLDIAYLTTENKIRLTDNLLYSNLIEREMIRDAAIIHGVDPSYVTSASAAVSKTYRITPLLESASVNLFGRSESDTASIEYRKKGSDTWLKGLDLQWNSLDNALSGSIVYLQEQTEYEVKVTLRVEGQEDDIQTYTFSTWDSQPQFDPNKIYQLSEIYSGGQLDLEALQIEGTSDGWVKIIGDANTPIIADSKQYSSAIHIGANKYIYFENITVVGGRFGAISSNRSHSLWFNGCDISGFGRTANAIIEGVAYENDSDSSPINYDSAFALNQTGRVVVENCQVHSPIPNASNWGSGHPFGANAYLAMANHPDFIYSGQVVLRNNRFYGTDKHRFNDVIESRSNGNIDGGFRRDSAIYNNYLAYANDDIVELDGGQNNVLFYNNELEQGYVGISIIPNRKGPSYLFNNYIHNLGDDRGSKWGAIKVGGLVTKPEGVSNLFYNYILTGANGITSSAYQGDYTFWVNAINNVMIHNQYWKYMGYSIYDRVYYPKSQFINNYMFNLSADKSVYQAEGVIPFYDSSMENKSFASALWEQNSAYTTLDIPNEYQLDNFTTFDSQGEVIIGLYQEDDDNCQPEQNDSLILIGSTNTDGKGSAYDLTLDNAKEYLSQDGDISDNNIMLTRHESNGGSTRVAVTKTGVSNGYKEIRISNNDSQVYVENLIDFAIDNQTPCGADITIVDAKRGAINSGSGDDIIVTHISSNSASWSNLFSFYTGDGDDMLELLTTLNSKYSSFNIDMGDGDDLVYMADIEPAQSDAKRTLYGGDGSDSLIINQLDKIALEGFEVVIAESSSSLTLGAELLENNASSDGKWLLVDINLALSEELELVAINDNLANAETTYVTEALSASKTSLDVSQFFSITVNTKLSSYQIYLNDIETLSRLKSIAN